MFYRTMSQYFVAVIFTCTCAVLSASASGGNETGNTAERDRGHGDANQYCDYEPGAADLSDAETDSILFIREEEKVARDSYLVLGDTWKLIIFNNIAESEQRHMNAIKNLINCYGLVDPVIDEVGFFQEPVLQALFDDLMKMGRESAMDGLKVGALIEETDIVDIQHAIDLATHAYIISTYESLMCGSRNHLRAFVRNIDNYGGSYTPSVLDPDAFWAIANSPMERDCGDD